MLYNKNSVRKTNDKKILHKVGKQWKVVSVALLMAIGGGAAVAATNNNANAAANNGVSASVQQEANELENDKFVAPASASAQPSSAASTSAKAPSLASVSYAPSARVHGNNASAAYYNNHYNYDTEAVNYYGPIVKGYVKSINARYPEARNLQSSYTSASASATDAQSSATSYSAVAANPSNQSLVSAMASKAGLTTSDFVDSVQYSQSTFASQVSAGSSENSAVNFVNSLVNEVLYGNVKASSADAKVAAENASAAYHVASATSSAHANNISAVESASSVNEAALNAATSASIDAAENASVAQIYSGIDVAAVDNAAKIASFGTTNTNSFASSASVSSAVSSEASIVNKRANNSAFYTYNFVVGDYAYTAGNVKSDMYRVLSDTAALSMEASVSASANSVIASAKAYKSVHANDLSSASAQATSDSSNVASAQSADDMAHANSLVSSVIAASAVNSSAAVSVVNDLLGSNAIVDTFDAAAATDPYFASEGVSAANVEVMNQYNTYESAANSLRENFNNAPAELAKAEASYNANPTNAAAKSAYFNLVGAMSSANAPVSNASNFKASVGTTSGNGSKLLTDKNGHAVLTKDTHEKQYFSTTITPSHTTPEAGTNTTLAQAATLYSEADRIRTNLNADYTNGANPFNSAVKASASAKGVDLSILTNGADNNAFTSYADAVIGYEASLANPNVTKNPVSSGVQNLSDATSLAKSAMDSSYASVVSASNQYSANEDEDVTLASYFASSYSDDANSEANIATSASNALNSYYIATANSADFTRDFNTYNVANNARANDHKLAHAFGVNVLQHSPQFVTLKKNAMLHNAVGFAKGTSVRAAKKGEQFAVKGVGFDEVGTLRYIVGTTKGNKPVYLTANDDYVENTYLEPEADYTVKTLGTVRAHASKNFNSKVVATFKPNTQLSGTAVATKSDNSYDYYFGVSRLAISVGKGATGYVTTNDKLVSVVPSANNNGSAAANNQSSANNSDLVLFK